MPVSYTNRKKDLHYIKVAPTKTGKQRFYVVKDTSKLSDDELLQEMSDDFEFHELPYDAQVIFRKKLVTNITQDDLEAVDEAMKNHSPVKDYILEKEKDAIVVFVGHLLKEDGYDERFFLEVQWYKDQLRFQKENDELFHAQYFTYLEDGEPAWLILESSDDLEYLANKYCSYFEKDDFLGFYYYPFRHDDDEDEDEYEEDEDGIEIEEDDDEEHFLDFRDLLPEGIEIPYENPEPKTGRNDPCSCGSGKKYKKC